MVLLVLLILKYLIKWFFKALFFIGGVVCTGIGGMNFIKCIYFLISGASNYLIPVDILTSLFNLACGAGFFFLVFHNWNKKIEEVQMIETIEEHSKNGEVV